MAVSAGVSSVAHGVHYFVLGLGLLGLFLMLGPHLGPSRRVRYDEHALRVAELRAALASGALAGPRSAPAPTTVQQSHRPSRAETWWLPLAVTSSAVAAVVHAAVCPEHFRERTAFGVFFAVAALAQVAWSVVAVQRCSRTLLLLGAVGNAGLVTIWLLTRTVGLPGLLARPEAVGPWDAVAVVWELVTVWACLRVLQAGAPGRAAALREWDGRVRIWALASAVVLVALTVSGAGA